MNYALVVAVKSINIVTGGSKHCKIEIAFNEIIQVLSMCLVNKITFEAIKTVARHKLTVIVEKVHFCHSYHIWHNCFCWMF